MPPVPTPTPLARLGDLMVRRRRVVVLAWLVGLVAAFGLLAPLAGEHTADYATPGSESKAASDRIREAFPGASSSETVDVVWSADAAAAPAVRARVDGLLARASALEGIGDGVTARAAEVSRDGRVGLVRLPLDAERPDDVPIATGEALIALAERASTDGVRVAMGGQVIADAQTGEISSEAIGLLIAALVLVLTFGSVVAAGLPLATALFGLGISAAIGGVIAAVVDVPDWGPSVAAMIGIGVGIDYALLVLTRYRAALDAGSTPRAAVVEAVATAGRSVLVAGTTVVISLLGLFLMGLPYLSGMATVTIAAVLVVMAASVTLLPALLGFARTGVNRLRVPGVGRPVADLDATPAARWSRVVQRRPWTAGLAGVAVLLVLAAPVAGLRLGFPDAGNDAAGTQTRAAYDLMAAGFGPGAAGPFVLVGDAPQAAAVAAELRAVDGVAAVGEPVVDRAGDTATLTAVPDTAPQDAATEATLDRVRAATAWDVGGVTPAFVDQSETTAARLPLFIGVVVGLSFLLLVAAFRAPLVALKAGVLNLLSIAAAYGVVSLVADGGAIGSLVGVTEETPIPPFIPVIMFAILFGLSMDYEVFLLSRIREEVLKGGGTARAVSEGLARTRRSSRPRRRSWSRCSARSS
jgi:RND superfamily putative drug exporter